MADEFLGAPITDPTDVPAEVQTDGQVTEDNTGEQVATEAGNPAWFDTNYPGQITPASSTTVNTSTLNAEQLAIYNLGQGTSAAVNPTTLTPAQAEIYNLGQGTSTTVNPRTLTPEQLAVFNLGQGITTPVNTATLTPDQLAIYNLNNGISSADPSATQADAFFNPTVSTTPALITNPLDLPPQYSLGQAFDEDGNLLPGWELNPEGTFYIFTGGGPTTNAPGAVNSTESALPGATTTATEAQTAANTLSNAVNAPAPVNPTNTGFTAAATTVANVLVGASTTAAETLAIQTQVGRQLARQQAVNAAQKKSINNGDWRVRLSLAPGARYLYNAPEPGILDPLTATNGVIFPYTPKIDMTYKADYDQYALTHSNYKGYFYKSSSIDAVQMHATFTAQDSQEADYLLAVIHFFRSVTKMFYGQDPQRGAPPPLVYLTGLGQYQFAAHPCAVTSFSYSLPDNVDYIRARSTNINGTNLLTRRVKQDLPTNPISGAVARLQNLFSGQGINYGAEILRPQPPTLGQNQPTYVPTKMDISLNLLPMQSRQQVSREFSLRDYSSGQLLKKGFW